MLGRSAITNDFIIAASLGKVDGVSYVNKFGETSDVDTTTDPQDIWTGAPDTFATDAGVYTFSSTADIDRVSSSDASDTQDITIIGLDTDWNEVTQTVTLTGQTPVALTTSLIRVYRAYNAGSTNFAGTIYVFVNGTTTGGVPDNLGDVRAVVDDGENQTEMAIYSVPAGKTALLIQWYVSISRAVAAAAAANFTYSIRSFGGVFQTKGRANANTTGAGSWIYEYDVYPRIPAKSDIKVTCEMVTANDTGVAAGFDLLLFDNTIWNL